jgi:hypothetical protein
VGHAHEGILAAADFGETREIGEMPRSRSNRPIKEPWSIAPTPLSARSIANPSQCGDRLLDLLLGRGTLVVAADRLRCFGAGCVMRDIREWEGSRPCWPIRYR